jgi:hypothetical protein
MCENGAVNQDTIEVSRMNSQNRVCCVLRRQNLTVEFRRKLKSYLPMGLLLPAVRRAVAELSIRGDVQTKIPQFDT